MKKELKLLHEREKTPGDFLMNVLGEKLIAADFSDEGNAFVRSYYQDKKGRLGIYLDDYSETFDRSDLPSLYHVEDSWENFDKLAKVIDRRFREWKRSRKKKRR